MTIFAVRRDKLWCIKNWLLKAGKAQHQIDWKPPLTVLKNRRCRSITARTARRR